eukprot:m.177434 g.177434  ORF g.177434 m.177434 type:complete len:261 (-) comp17965_c0_seq1:484-1266(-)
MDTATASDAAASAAVAVEGLLAEFEPGRVLAHPADGLTYAVLGSVASAVTQHTAAGASTAVAGATSPGGGGAGGGNDQAVVVVKSLRPNKKDIAGVISQAAAGTCSIDVSAVNQEYTFADVTVPAFPSRFGVTIVCPCLPHHVEKFTDTPRVLFRETRAVYVGWHQLCFACTICWLVQVGVFDSGSLGVVVRKPKRPWGELRLPCSTSARSMAGAMHAAMDRIAASRQSAVAGQHVRANQRAGPIAVPATTISSLRLPTR